MPCTIRNRAIILRSKSTKNTRSILFVLDLSARPPYPVARRPAYRVGTLVSPSSHPTMKTQILFLLLLLALSACSRRISERIAVHDTLRVALTDTLREHIMLTDSVLIHDTCYVENGVATRFRLVDRWRQTDRVTEKSHREQHDRSHDHRARHTRVSAFAPTGGVMGRAFRSASLTRNFSKHPWRNHSPCGAPRPAVIYSGGSPCAYCATRVRTFARAISLAQFPQNHYLCHGLPTRANP